MNKTDLQVYVVLAITVIAFIFILIAGIIGIFTHTEPTPSTEQLILEELRGINNALNNHYEQ